MGDERRKGISQPIRRKLEYLYLSILEWMLIVALPQAKKFAVQLAVEGNRYLKLIEDEWKGLAPDKQADIEAQAKGSAAHLSDISALDPGHRLKVRDAVEDSTQCLLRTQWRVHPFADPFYSEKPRVIAIPITGLLLIATWTVILPFIQSLSPNAWTALAFIFLCVFSLTFTSIFRRLAPERQLNYIYLLILAVLAVADLHPWSIGEVLDRIASSLRETFSALGSSIGMTPIQSIDWRLAMANAIHVLLGLTIVRAAVVLTGWIVRRISGQTSHSYSRAEIAISLSIYQLVSLTKSLDQLAQEGKYISSQDRRGLVEDIESTARVLESVWIKSRRSGVRSIDKETRRLGEQLAFHLRKFKPRVALGGDKNFLSMRNFFARATICAMAGEWERILVEVKEETGAPQSVSVARQVISKSMLIILPLPATWAVAHYTEILPPESHGFIIIGSAIFTLMQIATWLDPGAMSSFELAGRVRELLRK